MTTTRTAARMGLALDDVAFLSHGPLGPTERDPGRVAMAVEDKHCGQGGRMLMRACVRGKTASKFAQGCEDQV